MTRKNVNSGKWRIGAMLMLLLCVFLGDIKAQQPLTNNQYMFNGMLINPAYVGSRDVFTVNAIGRQQWVGIQGAPSVQTLAGHSPLRKSRASMGFHLMNENFGVTNRTGLFYHYAYRIKVGDGRGGIKNRGWGPGIGKLAFGMSAGLDFRSSQWSKVNTSDPNNVDPEFAFDSGIRVEPNIGAGLYFNNETFFAGFSVPRFFLWTDDPTVKKSELYVRMGDLAYYFNTGAVFPMGQNWKVRPSLLFKFVPNSTFQIDVNANFVYLDKYTLGFIVRTQNSFAGLVQIYLSRQFSFGYSYEYTTSALQGFSTGTHEFMLQYEFGFNIKSSNPRYF